MPEGYLVRAGLVLPLTVDPVHNTQTGNTVEFFDIVCHQRETFAACMTGNHQVIRPYGLAFTFKRTANVTKMICCMAIPRRFPASLARGRTARHAPAGVGHYNREGGLAEDGRRMVGATGIEPVTPAV